MSSRRAVSERNFHQEKFSSRTNFAAAVLIFPILSGYGPVKGVANDERADRFAGENPVLVHLASGVPPGMETGRDPFQGEDSDVGGKDMLRSILALERLTSLEPEGKVGYRWGWDGAGQETEVMNPIQGMFAEMMFGSL